MPDGLESKVPKADLKLVKCDWESCKERGEYTRCYFDIYLNCPMHIAHRKYLKRIEELKEKKKYKGK